MAKDTSPRTGSVTVDGQTYPWTEDDGHTWTDDIEHPWVKEGRDGPAPGTTRGKTR